jgi:hypothetical protein
MSDNKVFGLLNLSKEYYLACNDMNITHSALHDLIIKLNQYAFVTHIQLLY